jgi:lipid-binding SYLF domain-containing protein
MKNVFKRLTAAAFAAAALMFSLNAASAQAQTTKANSEKMSEGRKEAREAARVLSEMMKKPDDFVPRELLERASAIAIIPDVVKGAFIIGGRGGDGVVARRTATGWSVPVFYDMGGASFGAQIGVKKTDYIMLFMNEGSLRDLLDEKLEFGGGVSFAAGPVGRTAGAGTNPTLDAGILTWSRSEGAFVGASVKGAVLTADNDVNRAVYGMTAKEILANPEKVKMTDLPNEIKNFSDTVARYAGNKRTADLMNNQKNGAVFTNATYANPQDRSVEFAKMRSPQRLALEILNEILKLTYYSVFDWLEFDVDRNGVVTLRGQVTTPPDTKSAAESYVEDVEGVTRVVNNIEVLPVSPGDDRLRQALYREIYSGPLFRYQVGSLQHIHIIVRNGRATLKGVVDSEADKNLAGIRAKTVPGVFEVNNELVVGNDKQVR